MWTNKNAMRPNEYNRNWLASNTTMKQQEIRRVAFGEMRMRQNETHAKCASKGRKIER